MKATLYGIQIGDYVRFSYQNGDCGYGVVSDVGERFVHCSIYCLDADSPTRTRVATEETGKTLGEAHYIVKVNFDECPVALLRAIVLTTQSLADTLKFQLGVANKTCYALTTLLDSVASSLTKP